MANDLARCIRVDLDVMEAADALSRLCYTERDPAPDWAARMWCALADAMGEPVTAYRLSLWTGWGDQRARGMVFRRRKEIRAKARRGTK